MSLIRAGDALVIHRSHKLYTGRVEVHDSGLIFVTHVQQKIGDGSHRSEPDRTWPRDEILEIRWSERRPA